MSLIDLHVHIDYYRNFKEIYNCYEESKIYTLFVTNLPEIYEQCIKKFHNSKYVRIALGYNPQLAEKYPLEKMLFSKYVSNTKYIGEVGLDFTAEFKLYKNNQIESFEYICSIPSIKNKIFSVHLRKSEDTALSILEKNNIKYAVFHWYSGELKDIQRIIDNGYFFSINYAMLKSNRGREILKLIPLERILIESDGPHVLVNNEQFNPQILKNIYLDFSNFYGNLNFEKIVFDNFKRLLNFVDRND